MKKLTDNQLESIHTHLLGASPDDALRSELFDHLACQVEEAMRGGLSFESAWREVTTEASAGMVRSLKNHYRRELALAGESLQQATLTEIVFECRNKSYGAYPLRQAYPNTLMNALAMGTGLFIILFLTGLHLLG
jgi:hypothetical protein